MKFTLYWKTGKREVLTGTSISNAMNKCYSSGALRALDFYKVGEVEEKHWEFNKEKCEWDIASDYIMLSNGQIVKKEKR